MNQFYRNLQVLIPAVVLFSSFTLQAQLDLPRGSQKASVHQRIGITDVEIEYSRPAVNGREIWGALVPYGMNNLGFGTAESSPWRAGANENTIIRFSENVEIEGKPLAAGTYGLHLVVEEDGGATVIFSSNHGAWGSYFYDPSEDALRVAIRSEDHPHTEWLAYDFTDLEAGAATARLRWEKKAFPFRISTDLTETVMDYIRQELQDQEGFNRQSWEQAAGFALNNDGDLDEALAWIDAAIAGQFFSEPTFNNLSLKAAILRKQGNDEEARSVMEEAMALGSVLQLHGYGRQLIAQGDTEGAMEIFRENARRHKGTWPVDYGMARAYSAIGDYKKALKHLKIAQQRAPDALNQNAILANLEKLEKGEDIN